MLANYGLVKETGYSDAVLCEVINESASAHSVTTLRSA